MSPELVAALLALAAGALVVVRYFVKRSENKTDDAVLEVVEKVLDPILPGDQVEKKDE